jgi:hypothetical protein
MSYRAIGRALGVGHGTIRRWLDPEAREKIKEQKRQWYEANRDSVVEKVRLWRVANPERSREYARCYRQRNLAACIERCQRYYRANTERFRQYQIRWKKANPEKVQAINLAASRRWRELNPEKVREKSRRWAKAHPEQVREINRRRRAMRRSSRHQALVPLSPNQKNVRLSLFGNCCAYCGSPQNITTEHVLALKAGGLDEATNVIPACQRCNCSKQDRPVTDWYPGQSFFTEVRWRKIQKHCPGATGQLPLAIPVTKVCAELHGRYHGSMPTTCQ